MNVPKAAVLAAIIAFAVSGCGSDSDEEPSGSQGSASAQSDSVPVAIVELAEKGSAPVTEWPGPTDSPKSDGESRSFVVVPCTVALEGCKRQSDGFIEAAEALGWKTTLVDPKNDAKQQNAAIDQAITQKADGVFLVSIDPSIVKGALGRAEDAGIPVIVAGTGSDEGVAHEVSLHGVEEGELLAARIVSDTNGSAKIAMFTGAPYKTVVQRVDGSKSIFEQCDGCEVVEEQDISGTTPGAPLVQLVQSILQRNPDVDVLWAPYDAAAIDIMQAVQQAGRTDDLKVYSFNGNLQNLDLMRDGDLQTAVVAEALEWAGWAGADNFLRIFAGQEPVEDDAVPFRVLDDSSLPPAEEAWTGDFDFRSEYSKMWGVG
jgi:ribose transport system substrate-binding protein